MSIYGWVRKKPLILRQLYNLIKKRPLKAGTVYVDPRPWTEKFYEGQRSYYFIIKAESIQSYSLDIKVPTQYIGKY